MCVSQAHFGNGAHFNSWTLLLNSAIVRHAKVGRTIAGVFTLRRKVRAPKSRMPANGWAVKADGQCSRKYTADDVLARTGKVEMVR